MEQKREELVCLQDDLTARHIGLVKACGMHIREKENHKLIIEALAATGSKSDITKEELEQWIQKAKDAKYKAAPDCATCLNPCGNTDDYPVEEIRKSPLKMQMLDQMRELAFYACKSVVRDIEDANSCEFYYKVLSILSYDIDEKTLQETIEEIKTMVARKNN